MRSLRSLRFVFDEGIHITAGLRTLQGHGYSDRYLTWCGGTLLWPALAGIGYRVAGTVGARALALLAVSAGMLAFGRAARNLFGERAGFWATLALALNGALISTARLAVYDGLAWAGMAVSFWALTELARHDHRKYLLLTVTAYVLGTLAKHPTGVMLLPLLGILTIPRPRKASLDLLLFGYLSAQTAVMVLLPWREQVAIYFRWRLTNTPSFGVTLPMIAFTSWSGSDREFPTEAVALAHRAGWIPVLTWEPWERNFVNPTAPQPAYSLSSIAAGQHDKYIRSWARAARAVGGPIVLRFAHEQSTEPGVRSWYP